MDLELTAEQDELRAVAREILGSVAPLGLARDALDRAGPRRLLEDEIGDLGWSGVGMDDGDEFGLPGLCLLAEELGAHVAASTLVDAAVVGQIVQAAGGAVAERWLAPVVDGRTTVALAAREPAAEWDAPGSAITARPGDAAGTWVLSGVKDGVLHGDRVGAVAVLATVDGRRACFLVDALAPGVTTRRERDLDESSGPAQVHLDSVLVTADSAVVGQDSVVERALAVGRLATASEALGAAGGALEMALRYATEREQFGRPIGAFQSIQHLLADLHVLRETSRSTILYAAASLDEQTSDAMEASRVAKAHAARSSRTIVEGALQVLGGIGFTWEHDLHLLFRRVLSSNARFGDVGRQEAWIGERLSERTEVLL